jgi:hypothetical protein
MVMRMLKAGGVGTVEDGRRTADIDNPEGYLEDQRVKCLTDDEDRSWLRQARGKAVKVITYLLMDLPGDNNYKLILVERDMREVLASQAKMLERRGEESTVSDERMAENFRSLMIRTDRLLNEASHFETLRLRYADILADPRAQAERIATFLGREVDVASMAAAVDPSLYRNRAGGTAHR